MKACVLEEIGKLNIKETEKPHISNDEVLVKVRAVGICGSDIPRAYKTGAYSFPLIIGHEFSGEIADTGKRVGVFPLIPCMKCDMCKAEKYEMCKSYGYIGSRQDGAFAEYVRVPKWNLIELPENVSFKQAAMLEPLSVAIHAIRRAGLLNATDLGKNNVAGKKIAIIGLGTIGLLLTMVLKNIGYKNIFVIGNKELQKQKALEIGIPESNYIDSKVNSSEKNNSVIDGVDIFFECVGNNDSINTAVDSVSPNGTVVLVGNPAGDITLNKQVYWKILRRQLYLTGTWNSSFTRSDSDDWHYAINEINSDRLHPEILITHEYPLEDIVTGFELMRDKKEEYIKVMGII